MGLAVGGWCGCAFVELVLEAAEPHVKGDASTVVALVVSVVQVMLKIGTGMVLKAGMVGSGGHHRQHAHPENDKGMVPKQKEGTVKGIGIQVLGGVHAQSRKGFNVNVAVMDRMDVFVDKVDVDETVGKVQMNVPMGNRDPASPKQGRLQRKGVGHTVGLVAVNKGRFRKGPLNNTQYTKENVVWDL